MAENSTVNNFRTPVIIEPSFMPPTTGGGQMDISANYGPDAMLRTPAGNVRSLVPPQLPMAPTSQYQWNTMGYGGGYGSYNTGFNQYGAGAFGYGGFGNSGGNYGAGYNHYNRFGMLGGANTMDPEYRFIQLAEAKSRPAFESIESLVSSITNIASMLDSTFFAITSSFRAILGVAANFGRLRGVFAQFWPTFAIFRGLSWIYKKILFWLRISNIDPSSQSFKKAFAEAMNVSNTQQSGPNMLPKGHSPWPVLVFLTFIFTTPYLIMKLLGTVVNTAQEEARNPNKWIHSIQTEALYDFHARNSTELTIRAGERVIIAPKEIQNTLCLLNTGWAMATTDGRTSGIVPINYVKSPQQMRKDISKSTQNKQVEGTSMTDVDAHQQNVMNVPTSTFDVPSV